MSELATEATTFIEAVAVALREAGAYNRDDQARPAAVLWPDRERQWEPLLPRLREQLPLLTLGRFDVAARSGPAYWLRYKLSEEYDGDLPPILYLPGVARAELRAVEECPRPLRPLAELQYRGVFWAHRNGRDWSVPAFLASADGGVGVEVSGDAATKEALLQGLRLLADLPVARLRREAPLRAEFFHALLTPDEARSLLEWLDDPIVFRRAATTEIWSSFRALARKGYGFDPERDGELSAAALLGGREGRWQTVWQRFREAPAKYLTLPDLLRRARPAGDAQLSLFGGNARAESWPQDNEAAENALRTALAALSGHGVGEARSAITALEAEHGARRDWVWADLGQAPLATALGHLATLAAVTARAPGGASLLDVATAYTEWGWRADAAAIDALAAVDAATDARAVGAAVGALYRPWLNEAATAFQSTFITWLGADAHSADVDSKEAATVGADDGTCFLFADGLRFDVACRLTDLLAGQGYAADRNWRLSALPGVTPTAKPAISPVAGLLGPGGGFDTTILATGSRLTAEGMRRLLAEAGWQPLASDEIGDPSGRSWTEVGAIDGYGHGHGWKLAHHLAGETRAIARRVADLLGGGWQRVVVVTDHGWLLLPGGLPKADLPEHLAEVRKGRCARLKPDTTTEELTVPWRWDPSVRVAVARGIACYEAGKEYEHGGLSPQESIVPVLTVTAGAAAEQARIVDIAWRGLRCVVTVAGVGPGVIVDLRTTAGDAAASIVAVPKPPAADGRASLVVEDEERDGEAAHVVLVDADGRVIAQQTTTVGG